MQDVVQGTRKEAVHQLGVHQEAEAEAAKMVLDAATRAAEAAPDQERRFEGIGGVRPMDAIEEFFIII